MSEIEKSAATWHRHERDKLIKLVGKLGSPYHCSHTNERNWRVFKVGASWSTHLTFEESGHVYVTRLYAGSTREVEWLPGGFYAWIGELQIGDDEMAECLLGML